jgi:hypothetical protein
LYRFTSNLYRFTFSTCTATSRCFASGGEVMIREEMNLPCSLAPLAATGAGAAAAGGGGEAGLGRLCGLHEVGLCTLNQVDP